MARSTPADEQAVRDLYQRLHAAWNRSSGDDFAALFAEGCDVLGYDGSFMHGPSEVYETLNGIFAHHQTARYIAVVKSVRFLAADVGYLRAFAGLVPPGQNDINPDVNAWQTLTAIRTPSGWKIACFQNTPAQFHGRPELSQAASAELRAALHNAAPSS